MSKMLQNSPISIYDSKIILGVIPPDSQEVEGEGRRGERRGGGCVMTFGAMDAPDVREL